MHSEILIRKAKFKVGALVRHALLEYRGIVTDADPIFCLDASWKQVAEEKEIPGKDAPWYQVLVDGTSHIIYVPEQHLKHDSSTDELEHPALEHLFTRSDTGAYHRRIDLQ